MPIKALLLTFLTFFAGFLLTSEAIGQVGLLLLDKPAATKEDINGMRGLIKKEFSAQGALLKNEDEALGQLKTQINILNKSLDAIEAQASVNLNHLRLSNGLGVGLLLLQMLGLWLLKRHGGTTVKMPSNDIGSNNFTVDFKRSKTILQLQYCF